jgi:metal-dependent amidase/aminoacylase/carboxypeptidase family protein
VNVTSTYFARAVSAGGDGGAIAVADAVAVANSTFVWTSAPTPAARRGRGGAVFAAGVVTLQACSLRFSLAGSQGGAVAALKSVDATGCSFANMTAMQTVRTHRTCPLTIYSKVCSLAQLLHC